MELLPQKQNGQALIIVLLVMAVIMTVTLSIVSRSLTDITISTYEEDALRAFSAAEAGIEKNLLNPVIGPISGDVDPETQTSYSGFISDKKEPTKTFKYPKELGNGEVATFWLVSHDNSGDLTCSTGECFEKDRIEIYWGNTGTTEKPAVEVTFFYDLTGTAVASNDYSNVKNLVRGYDPVNPPRPGSTLFTTVTGHGSVNDEQYEYKASFPSGTLSGCSTAGCSIMVKVRMLYNTTPQKIAVRPQGPANNLPSQGIQISSVGSAGDSTRSINVFQSFEDTLDPFDSAVFSGTGGLTK